MKKAFLTALGTLAMLMTIGGAVSPTLAQGGGCLSPNAIQQAIQSGEIQSWAAVKRMAGIPSNFSEVSAVEVCQRGGGLYYSVSLVSPSGEVQRVALNAVDGSR